MATRDHITEYTTAQLKTLEENCARLLGTAREAEAREMLGAVGQERERRDETKRLENVRVAKEIRERMAGKSLYDRVLAAFEARPAIEWERDMIRALCRNPGATTETLSKTIGYRGTYMNWFGHVCYDRQPWLGQAEPAAAGQKVIYSDLLVDFTPRSDPAAGRTWTEWRFKPEAQAAFEKLSMS